MGISFLVIEKMKNKKGKKYKIMPEGRSSLEKVIICKNFGLLKAGTADKPS